MRVSTGIFERYRGVSAECLESTFLALDDDEGLGGLRDEDAEASKLGVHHPGLLGEAEVLDGAVGQSKSHGSLLLVRCLGEQS